MRCIWSDAVLVWTKKDPSDYQPMRCGAYGRMRVSDSNYNIIASESQTHAYGACDPFVTIIIASGSQTHTHTMYAIR